VKSETISNCWRKVGFQVVNDVDVEEEEVVPSDVEEMTNLHEDILLYEDNETWEHDVLFPLEVQEVEEDDVDLEVSSDYLPSFSEGD
jgi:hypothetical protein